MKFRYYIIDLTEGTIIGTNSSAVADHYAVCDDFFVIDAKDGLNRIRAMDSHVVSSNIAVCLFGECLLLLQDDEELEINEVKLDE